MSAPQAATSLPASVAAATAAGVATVEEEYMLSPISKWRRYGRVPVVCLSHIAVVALTSLHVLIYNDIQGVTHRAIGQDFQSFFFQAEYAKYNGDATDNPSGTRYFIFDAAAAMDSLSTLTARYWSMPTSTLVRSSVPSAQVGADWRGMQPGVSDVSGLQLPIVTHVNLTLPESDNTTSTASTTPTPVQTHSYVIPSSDLNATFPFAVYGRDPRVWHDEFFASLVSLTYDLRFRVWEPELEGPSASPAGPFTPRGCHEWSALLTYDMSSRSHIEVTWQFNLVRSCGGSSNVALTALTVATLLAVLLIEGHTLVSVLTTLLYFTLAYAQQKRETAARHVHVHSHEGGHTHAHEHTHEHAGHDDAHSSTTSSSSSSSRSEALDDHQDVTLTPLAILRLLRFWMVLTTAGNLGLLYYCVALLANGQDPSPAGWSTLLGLSASALWLSLLRYMDYDASFYATMLTISQAAPRIARFLIGVTPVFVALCLFAMVVFGRAAPRYANPVMSFMTLFSFYNGDALRETFTHTERVASTYYTLVADVHLCLLILTFTYVVTNVMVALVEEAFFNTRGEDAVELLKDAKRPQIRLRSTIQRLVARARARGR